MLLTLHIFRAHWSANGDGMQRFAHFLALGLLLGGVALAGGCGSASGLIPGSTTQAAADMPGNLSNDSAQARPIAVAWTSARAERCGFYFDATKLRTSYLAYEAKQTSGAELAKAEKSYDTTFKVIRERVSSDPDYCTDKKGAEIKADLQRHLKGDFSPNFPKAKVAETCGFFGCAATQQSDEPFNSKKLFEDLQRKQTGSSY
jgi:hypothetical protein